MLMTTGRLVILRGFNATLGRSAWMNAVMRRILVAVLIRRRPPGEKYVASSRFFDIGELDRH